MVFCGVSFVMSKVKNWQYRLHKDRSLIVDIGDVAGAAVLAQYCPEVGGKSVFPRYPALWGRPPQYRQRPYLSDHFASRHQPAGRGRAAEQAGESSKPGSFPIFIRPDPQIINPTPCSVIDPPFESMFKKRTAR